MEGSMQFWPLTVSSVVDYAARWHPEQEIISKSVEGPIVISTYRDLQRRSKLCALALQKLGIKHGDVVGTLAWNTVRHLESWYGIMGIGAVCHTLNPRLSDADISYIAAHGEDKLILVDLTFLPILGRIWQQLPQLQAVIVLTDRQHMPWPSAAGELPPNLLCYEELLDGCVDALQGFQWPALDENTPAGLCYTSGTTGNPKGVRYSHRSNFLHSFIVNLPDALSLGSNNTVLMVVPAFHANSWGMNFAAPMVGARLVLPGPGLDGASIFHLLEAFNVDVTAAVPTVVLGLLQHMLQHDVKPKTLRRLIIGGAAPPASMIEAFEKRGVEVRHMWGMTELSPLGSLGVPTRQQQAEGLNLSELVHLKAAQGRPHILCDMRLVDDNGRELPRDGSAVGELQVRGSIVVQQYHKADKATVGPDRWFSTGDVATIDSSGTMRITDRSKDVVKSGGEWISSIQLENTAMGHPKVLEAAVIALPDERWGERPLLIVVPQPAAAGDPEALRAEVLEFMHSHPQVAKFARPDDVAVLPEIPHTATGKVSKLTLRKMFKDHKPRSSNGGGGGSSSHGAGQQPPRSKL